MKFFIHYRTADGEISGWGNGYDPIDPIDVDHAVAFFAEAVTPDPETQKIDPATGELIDKTPAEVHQARRPRLIDVQAAIYQELARTDKFMISDYPVDDFERDAWRNYRKTLRELRGDPVDMVKGWPKPPTGDDPAQALRKRL